jgi:hypothetical protein
MVEHFGVLLFLFLSSSLVLIFSNLGVVTMNFANGYTLLPGKWFFQGENRYLSYLGIYSCSQEKSKVLHEWRGHRAMFWTEASTTDELLRVSSAFPDGDCRPFLH